MNMSICVYKKGRFLRRVFRGMLAFCALSFFVSSVAVPIGPAHQYLKGSSRSGHFSKISRTSEPGVERAGDFAAADQVSDFLERRSEWRYFPALEIPSPKVPRLLRFYYFKPPPNL